MNGGGAPVAPPPRTARRPRARPASLARPRRPPVARAQQIARSALAALSALATLLALWSAPARAARPPDEERARRAAEAALGALGAPIDPDWLRSAVSPRELEARHPEAQAQYYRELAAALGPGGALGEQLVAAGAVAGVIRGPDYVRVVLEGEASLVVRRGEGGVVIDAIELGGCDLCGEPERFVLGLIEDVSLGSVHRLSPGLDLEPPEWLEDAPDGGKDWRAAWQLRNATAGYLRWLLQGAEVVSAEGDRVDVALGDRTETWTVRYREHRWSLRYDALPDDSPLRLAPEETAAWRRWDAVQDGDLRWWTPLMLRRGQGTLIAEGVLFISPRPVQGDVLLYTQALHRRSALLVWLDPERGEVLARAEAPRLSPESHADPLRWQETFAAALSPTGKRFAVASPSVIWLFDANTGALSARSWRARASPLAWSPDGGSLAVGLPGRAVELLDGASLESLARHPLGASTEALIWLDDVRLLAVGVGGEVAALRAPGLSPISPSEGAPPAQACCGQVRGAALEPVTGAISVGCAGSCDPAWLWRWEPGWTEPEVAADDRYRAPDGGLFIDPSGRWMIGPSASGGATLWDLRAGVAAATFGEAPLRQVAWSSDGAWIWAVDARARAWRWEITALLDASSGP